VKTNHVHVAVSIPQ
jgi:hypothetical protein